MKLRFFCLLVALFLATTSSVFAKQPQRGMSVVPDSNVWGNYYALIIGINDYKEWPRLQTAVKDATAIRDTLVARYGFDKQNVILRTDQIASRLQIIHDLRYLAQSMGKDDNLFIYYAGHGQLDDFTGDGYWVPAEGKLKDPGTWVANSYIKSVLSSEKLQAKNVVIIADSCYSGSMLRGGPSLMSLDDQRYREKLAAKASLRSRQVISSGGVEPVADGGAGGHSLFAYYLIDALQKNDREVIDLENLFHTKVWKPVTEIGNQRPNVGRLKTPMDQEGQFVLYNVALARAVVKANRPVIKKQADVVREATALRSAPQNFNAEEETWKIVMTSAVIEDYTMFLEAYPDSRFKTAAKLKIQQLKRKLNAQTMTASAAPAVVKPGLAKSAAAAAASSAGVVAGADSLIKYATGIVYDQKTNLEWYVGPDEDTNWYTAKSWIEGLDVDGGGWRMPKTGELQSLYEKGAGRRNISSLFMTKGTYVWSGERGTGQPFVKYAFSFPAGSELSLYANVSNANRAFAVRSRKKAAPIKVEAEKPDALYASVAPAVADQSDTTSRRAAQNRYKLALFPVKVSSTWGSINKVQNSAIKAVESISEDDTRVDFKLSFKGVEGLSDTAQIFAEIAEKEENQVWKKKSVFTQYEPDWEQMKKVGAKIDADLAILISIRMASNSEVDVFLYDYKQAKAYSRKNRNISFNDVQGGVRQNVLEVMKEFFKHQ